MGVSAENVLVALEAKAKAHAEREAKRVEQAEAVFAALVAANPGKRFYVKGAK